MVMMLLGALEFIKLEGARYLEGSAKRKLVLENNIR